MSTEVAILLSGVGALGLIGWVLHRFPNAHSAGRCWFGAWACLLAAGAASLLIEVHPALAMLPTWFGNTAAALHLAGALALDGRRLSARSVQGIAALACCLDKYLHLFRDLRLAHVV